MGTKEKTEAEEAATEGAAGEAVSSVIRDMQEARKRLDKAIGPLESERAALDGLIVVAEQTRQKLLWHRGLVETSEREASERVAQCRRVLEALSQ